MAKERKRRGGEGLEAEGREFTLAIEAQGSAHYGEIDHKERVEKEIADNLGAHRRNRKKKVSALKAFALLLFHSIPNSLNQLKSKLEMEMFSSIN